jgi:hypothetical protein
MFGPKKEEVTRNIFVDPWFIQLYTQAPPHHHQSKMHESAVQHQTLNDIQFHKLFYTEPGF